MNATDRLLALLAFGVLMGFALCTATAMLIALFTR
jgi:hypothetical protein